MYMIGCAVLLCLVICLTLPASSFSPLIKTCTLIYNSIIMIHYIYTCYDVCVVM